MQYKISIQNYETENKSETQKKLICTTFHIFNHSILKNIVSKMKDLCLLSKTFIVLLLLKNVPIQNVSPFQFIFLCFQSKSPISEENLSTFC